jgi:hypothetical protein
MCLRVCTFPHVICVNIGIFRTTWPPNASTSSGAQVKKLIYSNSAGKTVLGLLTDSVSVTGMV